MQQSFTSQLLLAIHHLLHHLRLNSPASAFVETLFCFQLPFPSSKFYPSAHRQARAREAYFLIALPAAYRS